MGGQLLDEHVVIERAKRGDEVAFAELVQRYEEVAFRTAYVITGDAGEAEDAAQTGFVKAFYALARFRSGAPFRPWLLQIVANEARNRRTAASRRPAVNLSLLPDEPAEDGDRSPETLALAADESDRLIRAINCLREEDRAVLTYRYFLDLSEAEMASALACRPGTVKSRLSRAIERLREQLAVDDELAHEPGRPIDG